MTTKSLGPPIRKVRVFRQTHSAENPRVIADLTLFKGHAVASYYDPMFEGEIAIIHDSGMGGAIELKHGAAFFDALERRYFRSSVIWVSRLSLH